MPFLHRDIETFSTLDLTRVGARRYAADPTTGIWCISYAVNDGPTQLWMSQNPIPDVFFEAKDNTDWLTGAHNDSFESAIEELILAPRFEWPLVPIERHRCTMAQALACGLPGKLEKIAEALSLPIGKDAEGARLMRMMAKPRKPRRGEDPNGGPYWHDDPEKIARLGEYSKRDTELEREVHRRLPALGDAEQALWVLDATINNRGFFTDGPLLGAASRIAAEADQAAQEELAQITNGALASTHQTKALLAWLAEHGCVVANIQKPALKNALRRKGLDPVVRRVIELRLRAAHAAASKIDTLLSWRNTDGRVKGTLQFHGAGTGRWVGRGPQPQNFKRDGEDIEGKCKAIVTGDLALVAKTYPQPLEAVGDIARATICAAPGHRLLIGDFSGIESRVTAGVSGQQTKLDQWAKFDTTGDPKLEPYYLIGRACGLPEEVARDKGKVADLAFGFQGGKGAWDKLAPEDDASTDQDKERYKATWRGMHPRTTEFWSAIDRAALRAVRESGKVVAVGRLSLVYDGSTFLRITLPSGRALCYPFPRIKAGKFGDPMVVFKDSTAGKFSDCRFGQGAYGGLWTENIVQGMARDLLAAAMQRLEAANYPIVLHVHDEIVCELPRDSGSLAEFQRLLTAVPDWAKGLPVAAKVREGERFSKSKPAAEPIRVLEPDALEKALDDAEGEDEPDLVDARDDDQEPIAAGAPGVAELDLARLSPEQLQRVMAAAFRPAAAEDGAEEEPAEAPGRTNGSGGGNRQDHGGNGTDPDDDSDDDDDQGRYAGGVRRKGRVLALYLYCDHLNRNHTKVEKRANKQFPQEFWVGGQWVKRKPEGWQKIPYRLPELLAAAPGADVFIPEGEKDAESLRKLGLVATTSSEGATPLKAKVSKWTPELNRWFSGVQRAFILEDNDEPGRKFAREKAQALTGIVPDVRIVSFPDVPDGQDVSYWLEHGHDKAELLSRCEAAPRLDGIAVLESTRASNVTVKAIEWLWPERFALGKLGILAGLPDEGKSLLLSYIAARITSALDWPNAEGKAPLGNVILLTGEDDPADTVVPRLMAAGADLNRVEIISMVRDRDERGLEHERMFSLGEDLILLRRKIDELGEVKAILIDPVTAYLGKAGTVDAYRDSDVRAVLTPLVRLAQELRIVVIIVMHFNKKVDITNALLRISNSLAFGGVARHVFSITDDEENDRKLMARAKNNIAARSGNQTLAYHFETRDVGSDPESGETIRAPLVVFDPGYVDVSATEALSATSEKKSPGERDKAKNLLLALLAGGREAFVDDIKDTAEGHGISWRTMRRAADDLQVVIDKDRTTTKGRWFWKLP